MPLLDSLIVASCVGLSGQANDACNKALQAGTQQSGVQQIANNFEQKQTKNAEEVAKALMGETAVGAVGGTVWLAKSVSQKKVSFGLYGPISTEISPSITKLILRWSF